MKTLIKSFVVSAFILIPYFMNAQSPLDKVFDKYAGKEGFTTVNISKEMFQMLLSMADDKDTSNREMQKMMGQLNGLKVLTCTVDSTKPAQAIAFYNEASAVFPPAVYKELMTVNDDGSNIRFITKQEGNGRISEMVMLIKGKHEMVVMSLTGIIDLSTVSKLSKTMNIKGMENLKNLKDKNKK
jgi:hypothetical protein